MKDTILKSIIVILVFTFNTPHSVLTKRIGDGHQNLWSSLNQTSYEARRSRAISSFNQDNSFDNHCTGTVITMSAGYATILKSHKGYGKVPYPSDYQCRWLIMPSDCELSLVCNLSTKLKRRARGERRKCSDRGDYLRLEGYVGALDTYYCGKKEKISIRLHKNSPLKMTFAGQEREVDNDRHKRILHPLEGFQCEVQCKEPENSTDAESIKSTATSPLPKPSTSSDSIIASTPKPVDNAPHLRYGCRCGELPFNATRKGRIVCPKGATNCGAEIGDVPWQVGLVFKGKLQPWCGGTLISDQYVLTAAHCIKGRSLPPFEYQVILGDNNWRTRQETHETRHNVIKATIHPRFEENASFDFDFAILKLSQPIDFEHQPLIRPACLPSTLDENDLEGKIGTASGWGVVDPRNPTKQANKLQKVNVKIMKDQDCQYKYPTYPAIITPSMFCASADSADSCYGDSGGPFTVLQNKMSILEGVISWGKSCAKSKWPGVYARVRTVRDWIINNIKDSNQCQRNRERPVTLATTPSKANVSVTTQRSTTSTTIRSTLSTSTTVTSTTNTPTNNKRCICGKILNTPRIICPHGASNCDASIGSVPWQVGLVSRRKYQPWCGGSLINDRYVLTAAHCVRTLKPYMIDVILGDIDWTTRKESLDLRRQVTNIHIHPEFGQRAMFDHDFALLKLHSPVEFHLNDFIRPVCLPFYDHDDALEGQIGTVSGWGVVDPKNPTQQTNVLQEVNVKIISNGKCRSSYPVSSVTKSMFCARANGTDSCYGDSGGPFTVRRAGTHVLEGVISWGKNCAKQQWPGVYSRVGQVLRWIRDHTLGSHSCWQDTIDSFLSSKDKVSNVDLLLNGK